MSSLKSVRQLLDSKSTRSTKSAPKRTPSVKAKPAKSMVEIEPSIAKPRATVNMKELLAGRSAKRLVSFDVAKANLPIGAHVSYVLHRLFKDRKTGELKHVYCNSGFYRGVVEIKSYDVISQKTIVTPALVVVAGKSTYQLTEDELKEFYVYESQVNFAKTPKERSNEQKRKERERSKSLDHAERKSKTNTKTDEILNRKVKDRSSLLDRESRRTKSLIH